LWVEMPNAPNLYWALAVLPRPFLDPLPACREDVLAVEQMFPWAKQLDGPAWTDEQVAAAKAGLDRMMDDFGLRKPEPAEAAGRTLLEVGLFKEAQKALPKLGVSPERLKAMPAFQVVALFVFGECRATAEEVLKWAHLPESFDHPNYKRAADEYAKAFFRLDRVFFRGLLGGLADGHAPAINRVFNSTRRLDRRLAMLRVIEAVRAGAALPAKLADVKDLPMPNDPMTGKPFEYTAEKDHFRLHAPPPTGEAATAANSLTYQLRMK
jgi:hypothetical protein